MKQKRKVKSLIPHKADFSGNFLTILLLVLSFMLCLGSASLMTTSVGAAEDEDMTKMIYSGMNDNFEVLYRLSLVDPESLTDIAIQEAYVVDDSLYLTPNKVIVTSSDSYVLVNNVDGENIYVNILGGEGNTVKSDNITIIAGNQNQILSNKHNNASLLGGEYNKIDGDFNVNSAPAVVAGGKSNEVKHNNGSVVVGGIKNSIEMGKENVILGGSGNRIYLGENVIVGGKNVEVDGNFKKNIFAFSNEDSSFEPESESAFYLNLTNGVGIHVDAVKTGVSVGGAVGFGKVDITNNTEKCKNDIIGMEGTWYVDDNHGCLVGCTKESSNSSRWELLDRGTLCEDKCRSNSSRCIVTGMNVSLEEKSDYVGYCVNDNIDVENASRCTSGEELSYKNVVFEGVLIDSSDECPMLGDNKCVYRCDGGYKLDGNKCVLDGTVISKQCTGPEITDKNATLVAGSEGLQKDEKRTLYDRGHAAGKNCAYECNDGYHVEGNACVDDWKVEPCTHGEKPDNAHYIDTGVVVRWVNGSWTSPDACLWDCDGEYKKDGDKCVLGKCIGSRPNHDAHFVTGSDEDLMHDEERGVYNLGEEVGKKCAYVCDTGHYAFEGECIPCPVGTVRSDGVCLGMVTCPSGYYVNQMNQCDPYGGKCVFENKKHEEQDYKRGNGRLGTIVTISKIDELVPSTGSKELKCIDGDKFPGNLTLNSCTYKCKGGNYCDYDQYPAKCSTPSCSWTNAYTYYNKNDEQRYTHSYKYKYTQTGGNKGNYTFSSIYTPEEIVYLFEQNFIDNDNIPGYSGNKKNEHDYLTQKEIEYIKNIGNGDINNGIKKIKEIKTDSDFHNIFDGWPEKCVYWCPEKNRNYNYDNWWNYACISEDKIAQLNNPPEPAEQEPSCQPARFYGYTDKIVFNVGNPTTGNQSWTYVSRNDYESSTVGCKWSCSEGYTAIMARAPYYNDLVTSNASLFASSSAPIYLTCYKPCDSGQWLSNVRVGNMSVGTSSSGGLLSCEPCPGGSSSTLLRTSTLSSYTFTGYRGCTCLGGKIWNGSTCECPSDSSWDGVECKCSGGRVLSGSKCECTGGRNWVNSKCECPEGQIFTGGNCECDLDNGWEINVKGLCVPTANCPVEWCYPEGGGRRECLVCPEGQVRDTKTCAGCLAI